MQTIESAVRERYAAGAKSTEAELCCPVNYQSEYLKIIPAEVVERDYGCGDPSRHVREGVATFLTDPSCAPHTVVVTGSLRPLLAEFFERVGPKIDVYAFGEIPPAVELDRPSTGSGGD